MNRDIGMLRLDEESEPVMLLDSHYAEHSSVLSPNDRFLAYVSDEGGREEVYLRRFPDLSAGRRSRPTEEPSLCGPGTGKSCSIEMEIA